MLFGGFWTGLTRDDVGGLRYIYRHNNYNIETAPTNSFGAGAGAAVSTGNGSPWTVPIFGTNTAGGVVIPGGTTNFVDSALRAGIGQIRFVRVPLESVFGPYISNTVSFTDSFITNGVERQQTLIRAQAVPDILFDAGDLQGGDTTIPFVFYAAGGLPWQTSGNGTNQAGPGTIPPSVGAAPSFNFVFNTVGPTIYNAIIGGNFFVDEINFVQKFFLWGSFDGSTDEPFIYPQGTSTEQVERFVLGGGGDGGGGGGGSASLVDVWTPATIVLLPPGTTTGGGTGGGTGTGTTP